MLRDDERKQDAFATACLYVMQNPVRAGFVADAGDWDSLGAVVPGYPTLHPLDGDFWRLFWELYWKKRQGEE